MFVCVSKRLQPVVFRSYAYLSVKKMETVLRFAAILGATYFVTFIGAAFVTALKKAPAPAVAIKSSQMVKIEYRRNH